MDNSTHDMSEKLVQYLDGELAEPEKESMEQRLAADKELNDELESLKATREAIKLYGLQQKVSGIHQQMMQEMQAPAKKMNPIATGSARHIIRYSIALAASVILVVGSIIGYNFYNLSSNKVFASNYHSYELTTVRDGDSTQVSPVEKAYREKNYKRTVELISQERSLSVKETFLAGMAYMELDNNVKAIEELKKVIAGSEDAKNNLFKDQAEYYLALTYIRDKDFDFALDMLRSIKENPGHLYNKKVTGKLIRQVKLLKWR